MSSKSSTLFSRRQMRNRYWIKKRSYGKPRLSVFRSNKHIYAQIIDDTQGHTLASASTLDKTLRSSLNKTTDTQAVQQVGRLIAQRALTVGVRKVVFDRGAYPYHGKIKALAESAREHGLSF